jgi:replication-associated recombination protein RarA
MDLFDFMRNENMEKDSPLASRLRPTTLDEVVGQEHIIGKDKLLYRAIKADKLSSIIFYGPPGTGKTTLAKVIANTTSAELTEVKINQDSTLKNVVKISAGTSDYGYGGGSLYGGRNCYRHIYE